MLSFKCSRGPSSQCSVECILQLCPISSRTIVIHFHDVYHHNFTNTSHRETAADENATSYFPLLDRISQGHFDQASTDRDLYNLFINTLQDDGHIADPESLSSFQFALSVHAAAPRIEAHYQFYNSSVLPSIQEQAQTGCESWVLFNGRQYCTPDLAATSGTTVKGYVETMHTLTQCQALKYPSNVIELPFDRILGDPFSKTPSILYADLMSLEFRQFHRTVSVTAKAGKSSYRVRYKPSPSMPQSPLSVSGYGVELALKRTDYIVIDDRQAEKNAASAEEPETQATLADDDVTVLKPLSASEVRLLDMKASCFVLDSADPLDSLNKLTQDFPKHSRAMSANKVSQAFVKEHMSNREMFLPAAYNIAWINGMQILARDFDAYFLLELLRRERKTINTARGLGLTGKEAVQLLSHPAVAEASSQQEPQRYNWQDDTEGGGVIMWLNDVEKDKRYSEWPTNARSVS